MTSILINTKPTEFSNLGEQEAEAREALNNTYSSLSDATMFALTNAEQALGKTRMTFIEGEPEMKYEIVNSTNSFRLSIRSAVSLNRLIRSINCSNM
jgi:hypothetical protein